ncbi:ABC transporter permease [Sphingobacterium sp. UBA1498]|uniref:ABC transporter permease n=1 Tax=Sphingobacterium sp. UBA1498 TaxID=1947481 RepID=UPI0025D36ED5|nr:ABC transporter permease [Sphingobacterium sp. UBA1498]
MHNYLKVGWRKLFRNKVFSLINILGLSLGLAACWIILLFVNDELSYDRYFVQADRIYRVVSHGKWDGGSFDITGTAWPLANVIKNEFPSVKEATRFDIEGGGIITIGNQQTKVNEIFLADKNFFNVFDYNFLAGNRSTALTNPQSVVLTEDLAVQLFGSVETAVNKTLYFNKSEPSLVTAVIQNVPKNTHFNFRAIRSFSKDFNPDWNQLYLYTYVLLKDQSYLPQLQKKLPYIVKKYIHGRDLDFDYKIELQPITDIHLHSNLSYELSNNSNIKYVYIFSIVGTLVLLIAIVNYINITTAQASIRMREIAVRKIIGSSTLNLTKQFLVETSLIIFCAALLSILLASTSLPWLNQSIGKQLDLWHFGIGKSLLFVCIFVLFLVFVTGIYPALVLSGLKTIPSLKNQIGTHGLQHLLRKSLVVFQFVIAVLLIVSTMVIFLQLNFMNTKDLGFDKNQVMVFHLDNESTRNKSEELRNSLLEDSHITDVAFASNPIGKNDIGVGTFNVENNGKIDPNFTLANTLKIDPNFIPAMHIQLVKGRNFDAAMPTDSSSVIINSAFAKNQGWTDALGKRIEFGRDNAGKSILKSVIGVVSDFHIYSLQHKIDPLIMELPASKIEMDNIYIRMKSTNMRHTIAHINKVYDNYFPDYPLEYTFLDETYNDQYNSEVRQGQILLIFSLLSIVIACLGLFGVITFAIQLRIKEIGIRKTLGATLSNLVYLLCSDIVKLVGIALLIALPIGWLLMNQWLQEFAYRISVSWWVLAGAGIIALIIAILTLCTKAINAARANPVNSLRVE